MPPVNRRHHMCVSLAMEIVSRISIVCPDVSDHFYLMSCEEAVDDPSNYVLKNIETAAWNLEKEHVLVGMKITVCGREGLLILDPGYHISRAVTIMKDEMYPHTGFFIQSIEPSTKREYCYKYNQQNFISWIERTTRGKNIQEFESLVFIERPYETAIAVTVRRNLVYNFRSLLSRDAKGRVFAGIYFPVVTNFIEAQLTLFYEDGISKTSTKVKQKISVFKDIKKVSYSYIKNYKRGTNFLQKYSTKNQIAFVLVYNYYFYSRRN
jgi:hypothetical protein